MRSTDTRPGGPGRSQPASSTNDRLRSWGWDYLVTVGWLGAMSAAIAVLAAGGLIELEPILSRPGAADVGLAAVTVVPLALYLTLSEASAAQATFGKRRRGLVVATHAGTRPSWARLAVRNVLKVLPWQLGHMAAVRFASDERQADGYVWFATSMILLAAIVLPVLVGRPGAHDRAAGTRVVTP